MSMLTPLFALAALAVLGPILLHLVRRKPKETLSFSSLMFLEDSPPKWTQQSRIEQWLLLALRSLVIALLALAFTRPYWASAAKLTGSNEIGLKRIVLMDQSASMRRAGIWDAGLVQPTGLVWTASGVAIQDSALRESAVWAEVGVDRLRDGDGDNPGQDLPIDDGVFVLGLDREAADAILRRARARERRSRR